MKKLLLALFLGLLLSGAPTAHAQQQKNTITLEPALVDINLEQGEGEYKTAFTLKNSYSVPVELSAQIKGIDEQAGIFIPDGDPDEQTINALKLSDSTITIPENSSAVVYMIINAELLSPGGHYATFVVTQEKIGTSNVAIRQSLSAGLFIVKSGGQVREVEPGDISYTRTLFGMPKSASVTLKNVGNVHIIPRASVAVYKGDTMLAKGIYNSDSHRVLPGRQYQEEVPINGVARTWLPTKLKVVFEYRADSVEEYRYSETFVWYVPPVFVLSIVLGVVLVLVLVSSFRKHKNKKRRFQKKPRNNPFAAQEEVSDDSDAEELRITVRRVPKNSVSKKIEIREE